MDKRCPIAIPQLLRLCEVCMYSKETLCDYPFYKGMSDEDMKKVRRL